MGRKCKSTQCSLKHNGVLLFNPVKIAETFNFFVTNSGPNIVKRISKGKKSPMTCLNNKILKSLYFYLTTPDEIIKIIKFFSNNKSFGPNSLATSVLKNCADVLSFTMLYLANLFFTTGEFPKLCRIAKVIPLFKKGDPLDCSNYRPISLLLLSLIYFKLTKNRIQFIVSIK